MPCTEESLANAFYFLMIISWEQLSLDLEVNVDSIPVLYHSYINKLHSCLKFFVQKIFMDFIAHKNFLPTKYFQTTVHTYVHTYTHTYMHTYKHAYIQTCICTYVYTLSYMHTCIHTYVRTYLHKIILCIRAEANTVGRIIFKDIKFRGYSKFHFK